MNRKSTDLGIVVTVALIAVVVTFMGLNSVALRTALALPLVLVLPGYSIMAAMFSRRAPSFAERLLLSVGLSLAITVLGGLVLHLTPWGLQKYSWVSLLAGITLSGSALALMRRRGQVPTAPVRSAPHFSLSQGLLLLLAAAVVLTAIGLAAVGANRQPTRFTQLWMLPVAGAARDRVRLGVSNMESVQMTYRLELAIGNTTIDEWQIIRLEPGERWETTVALPSVLPDTAMIDAKLYRLDAPEEVYRAVALAQ